MSQDAKRHDARPLGLRCGFWRRELLKMGKDVQG